MMAQQIRFFLLSVAQVILFLPLFHLLTASSVFLASCHLPSSHTLPFFGHLVSYFFSLSYFWSSLRSDGLGQVEQC